MSTKNTQNFSLQLYPTSQNHNKENDNNNNKETKGLDIENK